MVHINLIALLYAKKNKCLTLKILQKTRYEVKNVLAVGLKTHTCGIFGKKQA